MVKNYNGETYIIPKKFEEEVRKDERKKAEQDFQNSDYWNDYLAKVIADERTNILKEICEHERTMIDDDGKIHFVVKMIDVMKVFNKEQKK